MKIIFKPLYNNSFYSGLPVYNKSENGFSFEPLGEVSFSVMLGAAYTSIDISSDTGIAYYITGLNPVNQWVTESLSVPKSEKGQLKILSDSILQKGCGTDYKDGWLTYFDLKTGWICIGNKDTLASCEVIEFCTNTLAVVENCELKAIWIKPTFE